MTQEDIIRMANDAELCHEIWIDNDDEILDTLVKFAKLVAAAERDACLEICEIYADLDSGPDGIIQDYHAHLIRARGQQ